MMKKTTQVGFDLFFFDGLFLPCQLNVFFILKHHKSMCSAFGLFLQVYSFASDKTGAHTMTINLILKV